MADSPNFNPANFHPLLATFSIIKVIFGAAQCQMHEVAI